MVDDSPERGPARTVKLLGREPAAWIATLGAVVVAAAALGVPFLDAGQAAALTALLSSLVLIVTTRPIAPGLVTGVVTAGVALLAAYGVDLSDGSVAAVAGGTLAVFALLTRQQVEPRDTAVSHR